MTKTNKLFRQGDVAIVRIDALPDKAEAVDQTGAEVILAYGEKTGHHHYLMADKVQEFKLGQDRFISVSETAVLRHEEHDPITFEKGVYETLIFRQFRPL